jgi:hypothetical protein
VPEGIGERPNTALQRTPPAAPVPPLSFKTLGDCPEGSVA